MDQNTKIVFIVDGLHRSPEYTPIEILRKSECDILSDMEECTCTFTESNNHCECEPEFDCSEVTGYDLIRPKVDVEKLKEQFYVKFTTSIRHIGSGPQVNVTRGGADPEDVFSLFLPHLQPESDLKFKLLDQDKTIMRLEQSLSEAGQERKDLYEDLKLSEQNLNSLMLAGKEVTGSHCLNCDIAVNNLHMLISEFEKGGDDETQI